MSDHPTDVFLTTYRNHVIEECARVAEEFLGLPKDVNYGVAAAIRALKDKTGE